MAKVLAHARCSGFTLTRRQEKVPPVYLVVVVVFTSKPNREGFWMRHLHLLGKLLHKSTFLFVCCTQKQPPTTMTWWWYFVLIHQQRVGILLARWMPGYRCSLRPPFIAQGNPAETRSRKCLLSRRSSAFLQCNLLLTEFADDRSIYHAYSTVCPPNSVPTRAVISALGGSSVETCMVST